MMSRDTSHPEVTTHLRDTSHLRGSSLSRHLGGSTNHERWKKAGPAGAVGLAGAALPPKAPQAWQQGRRGRADTGELSLEGKSCHRHGRAGVAGQTYGWAGVAE